jgi:UDP:flavonoid glycosyltransferase YjiC (YdhE family)
VRTRRFLLTGHDAGGTVPPMIAVAEELVRRGHEVSVLSQPSVRARAERAGCSFTAFSSIPDYERRKSLEDQLEVTVPVITGPAIGDDLTALARERTADLLVVDANLGGGLAAAEALAQPSVVLLHSMYSTFVDTWFADFWSLIEPIVNQTREGYGLGAVDGWPGVFAGHDRLLSVVPSRFDAPVAEVPATMRHFGFLLPRPTAAGGTGFPAGDEPAVLVGLSTTYQGHERLLQTILDALGGMAVRALVTTAGQVEIGTLDVPPNVRVADFVPHAPLLDEAAVMVTHAGLGSVAAALGCGVPLVCTPIDRDQPLNARRVAELGAGIALTQEAGGDAIAQAIGQVVADPGYRRAAGSIAAASRDEGGAPAAADELEALLA